jgi:TRAP-type C4-dicarboxylate transport system substrate-binding protein
MLISQKPPSRHISFRSRKKSELKKGGSTVKKMRKGVWVLCGTILFLGLWMGSGYSAEQVKIPLASTSPDTGFNKAVTDLFAKKVSELSKGQVVIQKYLGGLLGGEFETLELAGVGEVGIVYGSLGPSRYAPGYDPTVICFYFPDFDTIERYWSPANPIYDRLQKSLHERGKLRHLAPMNTGTRAMTSNKPARLPADFKGIKMRVPEIPEYVETWKELGCLVTPMPAPEIFSSLQTGVIDAQENYLTNIVGRSLWEVQKYIIFTEHNPMSMHFLMSEAVWNKLSKENQQAVDQAARLTGKESTVIIAEMEKKYIATMKETGMTLISPDLPAIRKAARPAVDRLLSKLAPGVPEAAEKILTRGK